MSAILGLLLDTIPQLYQVLFLSSFIIMFSIIRLFPLTLYPVSSPLRNPDSVYNTLFIIHAAV